VFDLALSEEQEQLQHSVRSLFEKESGPELVRDVEPLGFSPGLWEQVTALGLPEMAVPETAGGSGAGLIDTVLVAELGGEFLAPVPLAETVVANRLLARLGTPEALSVLGETIGGGLVATLALSSPIGDRISWVPAGAVADRVIAVRGQSVLATADRPSHEAIRNLGSLPVSHRTLAGARLMAEGSDAVTAVGRAADEWRVMLAAWLVGAARRALGIAVEYTTGRKAFGVPIASYQSVAHRMADLATALDGALLLTRKAAWAADLDADRRHDRDADRRHELALMASGLAAEVAEQAATEALHFHGGYGFMLEYDIQLYLRRIKGLILLNGDQTRELSQLGDELWGDLPLPDERLITSKGTQ
jgi:alkylation response protein AidB-like acyl-CoA dehydrogenase